MGISLAGRGGTLVIFSWHPHPGLSKASIHCLSALGLRAPSLTVPVLPPFPPPASATLPHTPQVFYNGQRLKVKTFQEYVDMYLGPKDAGVPRVYERFSDRWEVCVATTEGQFNQVGAGAGPAAAAAAVEQEEDEKRLLGSRHAAPAAAPVQAGPPRMASEHALRLLPGPATAAPAPALQVSFVNSICTSKGGTHVNYVTDQVGGRVWLGVGGRLPEGGWAAWRCALHAVCRPMLPTSLSL